jgi:hypothetical protein
VVCPLLNITNAVLNTTNANYSTTVLVTCNSGYAIDPLDLNNNTALTVCTSSGNWSTSQIVCAGMIALFFPLTPVKQSDAESIGCPKLSLKVVAIDRIHLQLMVKLKVENRTALL